jgi:hypothetical protein
VKREYLYLWCHIIRKEFRTKTFRQYNHDEHEILEQKSDIILKIQNRLEFLEPFQKPFLVKFGSLGLNLRLAQYLHSQETNSGKNSKTVSKDSFKRWSGSFQILSLQVLSQFSCFKNLLNCFPGLKTSDFSGFNSKTKQIFCFPVILCVLCKKFVSRLQP